MFIPKVDKLRHNILKRFNDEYGNVIFLGYGTRGMMIPFEKFEKELGASRIELMKAIAPLHANGDIIFYVDKTGTFLMSTEKTIISFWEEKYLKSTVERRKRDIDFILKFVAVISLGLSLFTTVNTCNKSQDNKQEIQRLQHQIDGLKGK